MRQFLHFYKAVEMVSVSPINNKIGQRRMYLNQQAVPPDIILVPHALVDAMRARGEVLNFRKGNVILTANTDSQEVYLIQRGSLQVTMLAPNGRETIFRTIGAGQCFGELSAIDGSRRSANVTALSDGSALWMTKQAFLGVLRASGELSLWFLQQYTHQIRELTDRIYELSTYAVSTRLQCELLRLVMQGGVDTGTFVIRRGPTHAELAARIGTNRESVTREMGLLADAGILTQKGRSLTVHSVSALRALVADKMS